MSATRNILEIAAKMKKKPETVSEKPLNGKDKIIIEDLLVVLGERAILDHVDMNIRQGETLVIMGLSGMGKSTLLRSINRLLEPDGGRIFIDGNNILELSRDALFDVRKNIGFVFQKAALFDSMTVGENVGFGLVQHTRMSLQEIMEVVREKLDIVGLQGKENLMPSELSGGMQKRASLARALSTNPDIVLYDEPTTGLDPVISNTINELIIDMQRRFGVTSIVVTHDLNSAYLVADRIAMLHQGKIIEQGTPEEFRNSVNPVVQQFITGATSGPIAV